MLQVFFTNDNAAGSKSVILMLYNLNSSLAKLVYNILIVGL